MLEILFIHGTGVRLDTYDIALSLVRKQSERYLSGAEVHQCLWGDPLGAKLQANGASIPTYGDLPQKKISASEAEQVEQATWRMLSEDVLFEIRLLEYLPATKRELGPFDIQAGESSFNLLKNLKPVDEFIELLREKNLEACWNKAYEAFIKQPDLPLILRSANRDPMEISRALSRALVAALLTDATEKGYDQVSAATRTQLVDALITQLGGQPLAPFDWITKPLIGVAKHFATNKARRSRRALTDAAFPAAGDIMLYQARGEAIRGFIRDRILEVGKEQELIVIAHSLGGIATVDLLIQENLSHIVKGLVTVGSQSPFLYEINALTSLPYGNPLPSHFPDKWLNIWDPNDFLSYVGAEVFGDKCVVDFMVESGLSFPDSHSAYLDQQAVWKEIQGFFQW